ncbi:MAG TPA: pitrilysin family protein [Kofleriaceae bacterium]
MKLVKSWVLAAMVAFAPAAVAQPAPAAAAVSTDPQIKFERYKLPNGLEVILAPDPSVPLVAVNVWYHVGSGYEVPGKSGFAHLFEHMMFQGSKHVPEDKHFDILKKIGSDQVNGTTNTDRTNYFEVVPSNQIETALWLESDRMGYLLDKLTRDSLTNQIDVVRNERRQNYDNRPYGKALFAEYEALFPEGHPYRHLTIGKHEDLIAASVDDVKNFFKTWYVPANATLCISGDFDLAHGKELVAKWFGGFPTSTKPQVTVIPPPNTMAKTVSVTDDKLAKLTQVIFAWQSPANFAPGDAELDIAANALAAEGTGSLYKALVYDQPIAQSVRAGQEGLSFSGIFEITVTLRSDSKATVDDVKKIVMDQVAKLAREPLAQAEIDRVVAENEAQTIRSLETVFGRSQALQSCNHYKGDPGCITWNLDRYRKTTAGEIRTVVAQTLKPDHVVTVITVPQGK